MILKLVNSTLFSSVSIILIQIEIFIIGILLWINRHYLKNVFKISAKAKFILLLIIIIFSTVCEIFGFNFISFIPTDNEWVELVLAKNALNNSFTISNTTHGLVYPAILMIGLKLFGNNYLVASLLNYVLSLFSILLVFAVTQILFQKEKISLISTILYAATPLIFYFAGYFMGLPMIVNILLLSFVLISLLYRKYHEKTLFLLSFLLLIITAQTRHEYLILIIPSFYYFLITAKDKLSLLKLMFICVLFSSILLIPFFVQYFWIQTYIATGYCSSVSQITANQMTELPLFKYFDPLIQKILNKRFSLNYLLDDIVNFVKLLNKNSLIIIYTVILIGIIMSLKMAHHETLFLLGIFCLLCFIYIIDCAQIVERFVMPLYGLVIPFSGITIFALGEKLSRLDKHNYITSGIFITIMIISLLGSWYYTNYKYYLSNITLAKTDHIVNLSNKFIQTIPYDVPELYLFFKNIANNNAFILTVQMESLILQFKNYQSNNLSDILNPFNITNDPKMFLSSHDQNYFLSTWRCGLFRGICEFVMNNYDMELIKESQGLKLYFIKGIKKYGI